MPAQENAALASAIAHGARDALVAAMHTGQARLRRQRQHPAR